MPTVARSVKAAEKGKKRIHDAEQAVIAAATDYIATRGPQMLFPDDELVALDAAVRTYKTLRDAKLKEATNA